MRVLAILAAITAPPSVPVQYQGEASVYVHFVRDVAANCPIKVPAGMTLLGCHQRLGRQSIITLPLPCNRGERYADIVCHEVAHAKGWPADHRGN